MVPYLQDSWVPAFAGTTERSNFTHHFKVVKLLVIRAEAGISVGKTLPEYLAISASAAPAGEELRDPS